MLSKLLKYDFRALMPWYGVLGAVTLVLAVLNRIAMFSTFTNAESHPIAAVFSGMATTMLTVVFFLSLAALSLMAVYLPAWRFYQSCLGEEGYLTFTLPVTHGQLYASKMISSCVGMLAATVWGLGCVLLCYLGVPGLGEVWEMMLADIGATVPTGEMIATLILTVIALPVGAVQTFGTLFTSLMIGQMGSKHRIFRSVVAYFAIQTVLQTVMQGVMLVMQILMVRNIMIEVDPFSLYLPMLSVSLVFSLAVAIAGVVVPVRMMKKNLNPI